MSQSMNTDRFIVERSLDGTNFQAIGSRPAAGISNTLRRYDLLDENVIDLGVQRLWYRLVEIDLDANQVVFDPKLLTLPNGEPQLVVYPNPAQDQVEIAFLDFGNQDLQVTCYNHLGQHVFSTKVMIDGERTIKTLDLANMSQGIYQLVISSDKGQQVVKLEKF